MGLSNNRLKFLQSLQNRKFRRKYGYFLVEGEKAVKEFSEGGLFQTEEVFSTQPSFLDEIHSDVEKTLITEKDMNRLSAFSTASPAACLVQLPEFETANGLALRGWHLAVDRLNDPGNLGSIIRIADWYGLNQLFIGSGSVDPYNPKVVSSSMGSLSRVKPLQIELETLLPQCQIPVMAAILGGEDVRTIRESEGMIIIGSESHGISESILSLANKYISIHRKGMAESLNAAVATGIICDRLMG